MKSFLVKTLLIFSIIGTNLNIRAEDEVIFLERGKTAPFSGILFTEAKANSLRKDVLDADKYKILNETLTSNTELYKQTIDIKNDQINLLKDQNEKLADQIKTKENVGNYERIIWFGLGILATGFGIYGASLIVH